MKEELMHIKKLADRVWDEIEKTDVAAATIKNIGEAVDILKDLSEIKKNCATVEAMGEYVDEEDGSYSGMRPYYAWGSKMYGAPSGNRSRNSNGTYRGGGYRGYDSSEDRERLSRYLERKMADASTDEERDIIRGCMEKLM